MTDGAQSFARHTNLTDPSKHATAIDALPNDPAKLTEIVRGLLIHVSFLDLYGIDGSAHSRETLPIKDRLDQILLISGENIEKARSPKARAVGTCRDYALMMSCFLKQKQIPARVRCGFATYFNPARYEDHWICEHWQPDQNRWIQIDAQLDLNHREHLGISFDTTDLPDGTFLNAAEAWQLHGNEGITADLFGYSNATGEWIMWVNLARDLLALTGNETSAWDTWRAVADNPPQLSGDDIAECDELASKIAACERQVVQVERPIPFWQR